MAGARCAFELLLDRIKNMFPGTVFPDPLFTIDISYDSSGDIVPMAGYANYGKRTIPDVHPAGGWDSFYRYIKNDERNGIVVQSGDKNLPKAVIYRDSFFTALEPFTSTLFSQAEYHWRYFSESEKEYILKNKPDIIIWEVVERSIVNLPNSGWN